AAPPPAAGPVPTAEPRGPRRLTKSSRPSGDQSVGSQYSAGHGSVRNTRVPSALAMVMFLPPDDDGYPTTYASRPPSGDQTGKISGSAAVVMRARVPRSRSSTQRSPLP